MDKKNIMFIIGTMRSGGAERVVTNLCNSLKDGYNVILIAKELDNYDYMPDVNVIEIKELQGCWLKKIVGIIKLKRLKRKYNITTSISFMARSNIVNYLSRNKEKVIISIRNHMSSNPNSCSLKDLRIFKRIIKKVDLIVNVSNSVKYDLVNNFKSPLDKNITIYNFCELDLINKLKEETINDKYKDIFKDGNVVISIGRFAYQKASWHLIRAFQKVVGYDKNIKLVLMGRGDLKEYYIELIKELGLEENVFIIDFDSNPYKYLNLSKMLILNSFYEGMSNVVLESLACGVPVIATDAPGGSKEILSKHPEIDNYVDELTEADYGILMPRCDGTMYYKEPLTREENIMADAIILLLKDKKLYNKYKKLTQERIKDFSKEKILNQWIDVIE